MSNLALLQEWYDRVWVRGELDAIDRFFVPEGEALGLISDMSMDPATMKEVVAALGGLMEVQKVTLSHIIEQGDRLAAFVRLDAIATDGGPVVVEGQVNMRFEGGRIAEALNHFDAIAVFERLGLLPRHTLALCLSGTAVA